MFITEARIVETILDAVLGKTMSRQNIIPFNTNKT